MQVAPLITNVSQSHFQLITISMKIKNLCLLLQDFCLYMLVNFYNLAQKNNFLIIRSRVTTRRTNLVCTNFAIFVKYLVSIRDKKLFISKLNFHVTMISQKGKSEKICLSLYTKHNFRPPPLPFIKPKLKMIKHHKPQSTAWGL